MVDHRPSYDGRESVGPSSLAIRGRDSELETVGECLAEARRGRGSVVLAAAAAGLGKSRLLDEAAKAARRLSFRVGSASAVPGDDVVPMGVLMRALFEGDAPLLVRSAVGGLRAASEQRYWLLQDLGTLLETAALETPLVVCLDDLQWADAGTAAALRALPMRLDALPIVWVAAFRPEEISPEIESAVVDLDRHEARWLVLDRLDDDAVQGIVGDIVGGEPTPDLLALAERAGGNPFLLIELLQGLIEEGLVEVNSGCAELRMAHLPARVRESMRDRLQRMSHPARQVARVASVLNTVFSFSDLAAMLAVKPPALLEPVEELRRAGILAERGGGLGFRHDLLREAVRDSLPASARQSLERQAVDVLMGAGASPVEIASQLAGSAQVGDEDAVATLRKAAQALASSNPDAAASLSRRALDLTRDDQLRVPLVTETAVLLHAAGRVDEGKEFADTVLVELLPAEQEAQVRLSIAGMISLSADERAEAGRLALALSGVSPRVRAQHVAQLVHNLLVAGRALEARALLGEARAAVDAEGDEDSALVLDLAEGGLLYAEGKFGSSLAKIEDAVRKGIEVRDDLRTRLAEQWRTELLTIHDRFDEALTITAAGLASAQGARQGWAVWFWQAWSGRQLFQVGRLADAAAVLEALSTPSENPGIGGATHAAGVVALGRVALHMGGAAQIRHCTEIARTLVEDDTPAVMRLMASLLASHAMSTGDARGARDYLSMLREDGSIVPLFPLEVTDEPQRVRMALAAGDTELAQAFLSAAEERLRANSGIASIAGAAMHARGLFDDDEQALADAVECFERVPRPLALASALEDLGRVQVDRGRRRLGLEALDRALAVYTEAGATWDVSRLRGRLRELGVRRRFRSAQRPETGWESLTESELAVARLVAEGLTNREVAERLFVSPHTVSTHLRHAFAKLEITSRVELARLALEHEHVA